MHSRALERMKERAFAIMRRKGIKEFTREELHWVFKHCKEKLLYTAIVIDAVENGLTIQKLYEQEHDRDMSR